ncbi:glutaredoxin family protein [Modicisalibacter tunisiensis]|nr:glutathione S-transferase N-terminal domain-containing protein [Modicisalibacter tunisiensis]
MLNMIRRLMRGAEPVERTPQTQAEADEQAQGLALYHYEGCPFCGKVRRAIARLNIEIVLHDINRDPGARQRLIAGGGRRTVPCLRIDDGDTTTWLYESSDIVAYLEKRFAAS